VYDLEAIPDVSIINRSAFPLSRQIDNDAGELVLQRIESLGVKVYTNCGVKDIITTTRSVPDIGSGIQKPLPVWSSMMAQSSLLN